MNRLRLGFAILGFGLALLGLATNERRLTWAAIAALLLSLILRVMLGKRSQGDSARGE